MAAALCESGRGGEQDVHVQGHAEVEEGAADEAGEGTKDVGDVGVGVSVGVGVGLVDE